MTSNYEFNTSRLCYKLVNDSFLDSNFRIKNEYKFKISNEEYGILNSKIINNLDSKFETSLFLPEGEGRKGEGGLRTKGYFKFNYVKVQNENGENSWWIADYENRPITPAPNDIQEKIFEYIKSNFCGHSLSSIIRFPLLTLVTVVYNGERFIEDTICSIIKQSYPNIEYIIIDGASSDKTLDVLEKYDNSIDYWVSEKDTGIYDAMNKSLSVSSGSFIMFINCGDRLLRNPMDFILRLELYETYDLFLFDVLLPESKIFHSSISWKLMIKNTIHHQGIVFRRDIGLRFNTCYKVFSDFDLNQRLYKSGKIMFYKFNVTISFHDNEGISNSPKYFFENYQIIKRNFGFFFVILSYLLHKYLGFLEKIRKFINV